MKYPSICFDCFKMPDFSIATTDICLTEDMSRYRFYNKGKEYFSYREVIYLIDFLNSGCPIADIYDIPTDEEFEQIVAKFGHTDGAYHSFQLAKTLGLGFYGSIGTFISLEDYNKAPQDFNGAQAIGYGTVGFYWCRGTGRYKRQASYIRLDSNGEMSICRIPTEDCNRIGLSVRLISRPW